VGLPAIRLQFVPLLEAAESYGLWPMKRIIRKLVGVILIILGLLALITPFSPGSWLALIGLELLGFRILLEKKLSSFLSAKQQQKLQALLRRFGLKRGGGEDAEDDDHPRRSSDGSSGRGRRH